MCVSPLDSLERKKEKYLLILPKVIEKPQKITPGAQIQLIFQFNMIELFELP
jgi:hypothetical protein